MRVTNSKYFAAGLCFLLSSSGALAQTVSKDIAVSISSSNTSFTSYAETIVKTKIINQTGQTIKIESSQAIRIMMTHPRRYMDCHRLDCFAANYSPGQSVSIPNGESFEFEVNLADLYWNDVISAVQDFHRPKNMFRALPSGAYELSVESYLPASFLTPKGQRSVFRSSDRIRVTVYKTLMISFLTVRPIDE
ncbi:MAG TPA: hypothetical protein VF397_15420 [Pyrinomonadaceae bacterium]